MSLSDAELAPAAQDRLVTIDASQAAAMRGLFGHVFGHEMTPEHWAWKYQQGPGTGVGLMRDGRMVAHYGGVSRRVAYFGQPGLACQVCDVMVERSANRALVRKGPLYQVAAAYLEQQVGTGRPHEVAFGFPSERHHHVAQRLGLYGQVDDIVGLRWPSADAMAPRGLSWQEIGGPERQLGARDRRCIDRLWHGMAAGFSGSVLGVRDADWVQYRYLDHPSARYELLLVRQGLLRRPLGLLVVGRQDGHLRLLDVVAPPAAMVALVAVARRRAAECGLGQLEAWVTRSHIARLRVGAAADAELLELNIPLPTIVHTPGPGVEALRGRWFLLAGDADFT